VKYELPRVNRRAKYPAGSEVSTLEQWLIHAKRLPPDSECDKQCPLRFGGKAK